MIDRKLWHPDITDEAIVDATQRQMRDLDDPGFCIACGNEQGGCEPDARRIKCEACGARQVFGAQELFMHIDADSEAFNKLAGKQLWPTGGSKGD